MELMTTCRRCREPFTPAHADYVRGTWQTCPACRERDARQDATGELTRRLEDRPAPRPLSARNDRDGPHRVSDPHVTPARVWKPHSPAHRPARSIDYRSRKV